MRILLIALCLVAGPALVSPAPADTLFRVASYNAHWLTAVPGESRYAPWKTADALFRHHGAVADVIKAIRPDILNLVEVTSKPAVQRLMRTLQSKGVSGYVAHHIESRDDTTGQDVAVITRHPLLAIDIDVYLGSFQSTGAGSDWRAKYCVGTGAQTKCKHTGISKNTVYFVEVAGRRIAFLGLHLLARPGDRSRKPKREAQARVAARILRHGIGPGGWMPIVLGDLNDYDGEVPDSNDGLRPITNVLRTIKDYDPGRPGNELVNPFGRLPKNSRYTYHWDRDGDGRIKRRELTMIDHILVHYLLAPRARGPPTTGRWSWISGYRKAPPRGNGGSVTRARR